MLLSTRAVNMGSGLLCLIIVAGSYDGFSAGRIYTIISLAGAAALFELGLSTLVLQRASQVTREKSWNPLDPAQSHELITPFIGHYLVLICFQALLLLTVLLPVGLWVIVVVFKEPVAGQGFFAWVGACMVMALGLPTALVLSILEGLGQLAIVAKVRAVQALTSLLALNLPLFLGFGYPAVAIQLSCALALGWFTLWALNGPFVKLILRHLSLQFVSARAKLDWPFQWRLSLSFLSGYFSNQAWVVAISLTGAVALAGNVAMTLQVLMSMVGFAMTPIAARLATLSALARKDSRVEYHKLTSVLIRQSGLIFLVMLAAVAVGFACANYWAAEIRSRLLPTGPLIVILLLAPLVLCLGALTLLNQSLGRDDLYIVSVFRICAPLVVISMLGGDFSAWSFTLSFTAIVLLSVLVGLKIHSRSLLHHLS